MIDRYLNYELSERLSERQRELIDRLSVEMLKNEKSQLQEKISKNYLSDILFIFNILKQGMAEKKNMLETGERGLE